MITRTLLNLLRLKSTKARGLLTKSVLIIFLLIAGSVGFGQVRLGQAGMGQVRLDQMKLGQVRIDQIRLGQVGPSQAYAQPMSSDSYLIQFGNFNMGAGQFDPSTSYNMTYTLGQIAPGPYGDYGSDEESYYFIGAGFQYIYQIGTFNFTISDIDIDLGVLTPGSHNTGTNYITISTRGAGGYTIYAYEQYRLAHLGGLDFIKDTECDTGYTCYINQAEPWQSENIPGFGFNISGDNVAKDFTTANPSCINNTYCFRPFADVSTGGTMQTIMSSEKIAHIERADIIYKAGIDGAQTAGNYETGIVFVAVPGY